jgi:hypothetical protein
MGGTPLSGSVLFLSRPCESFSGPARSGSVAKAARSFRIRSISFLFISRLFELIQISFRYDFQTLIPRDLQIHFQQINMHWKAYEMLYPVELVRIQIELGI